MPVEEFVFAVDSYEESETVLGTSKEEESKAAGNATFFLISRSR